MGLETGTYINDFNSSNPSGSGDTKSQGDDHLRLIKTLIQNTFQGIAFPFAFKDLGGSADTYTLTLPTAPGSYIDGMMCYGKCPAANTGAATINVNSLGAKDIKKNGNQDLNAGDMVANSCYLFIYNATDDVMELLNPSETSTYGTVAEVGDLAYSILPSKTGWLLCDGDTIGDVTSSADNESADYESLFTVIWDNTADADCPVNGGRGASAAADWAALKYITLPDHRGRVPLGKDNMGGTSADVCTAAAADALASQAGAESHTITSAEMPSHTHSSGTLATGSDGSHSHTLDYSTGSGGSSLYPRAIGSTSLAGAGSWVNSGGSHTHTISGSTGSAGSSTAMNLMNPYMTVNVFIKY